MNSRIEIVLTQSSIDHGRLYIESRYANFFPVDSYGDRNGGGKKGQTIKIETDFDKKDTDIRYLSSNRIGPRTSFGPYLSRTGLKEGDVIYLRKISERAFKLELN